MAYLRGRDQRGAVLALVAVLMVGLIAIASFVIDYARVKNARIELQAATDAAALAAAQDLPDGPQALATALAYSALGNKGNGRPDLPSSSISRDLRCLDYLKNLGLTQCPNAITVGQTQDVRMRLLGGLNIPGVTVGVGVKSTAAMKGGAAYPLDVVVALDRTGSMSGSKIQQARAGVRSFLGAMRPSSDRIGLVLFPPSNQTSCNYSVPGSNPYEVAQNGYVAVHLRSDFRTSDSGPLNGGSPLVQAVSGSCPSTDGITAYTTAMQKAKDELNANGRGNAQDVIIFFTDGEANYGPWYLGTGNSQLRTPCKSANDLATTLKAGAPPAGEPPSFIGGTWIYTILYSTSSSTRCKGWRPSPATQNGQRCNTTQDNAFVCDEQPAPVTAHNTVQSMASVGSDGQSRFYTSSSDLTQIFKRIAVDLSSTRLLPDNVQ